MSNFDSEQRKRIYFSFPVRDRVFGAHLSLNATPNDLKIRVVSEWRRLNNVPNRFRGGPRSAAGMIGDVYGDEALLNKFDADNPNELYDERRVYIDARIYAKCFYYGEERTFRISASSTFSGLIQHMIENADDQDILRLRTIEGVYSDANYQNKYNGDDYVYGSVPNYQDKAFSHGPLFIKVEVKLDICIKENLLRIGRVTIPVDATLQRLKELIGDEFGPEYAQRRLGIWDDGRIKFIIRSFSIPVHWVVDPMIINGDKIVLVKPDTFSSGME